MPFSIAPCDEVRDGEQILSLFNHAIATSTALYEYEPRTMERLAQWFALKRQNGYPVLGAFDPEGRLAGFTSYGTFRAFPANKYTVEHSVYVDERYQGRGLGLRLLQAIEAQACEQQLHVLVGVIDATNLASIALHEKAGFIHAGVLNHVGFKFGRWLDCAFMQKILPTPAFPVDG
jgi:phosphinothricin acetyltransferase